VSSPDLDDLRLLLAHAHTPPKIGFLRGILLRLRTKVSAPTMLPVPFPPTVVNQQETKPGNKTQTDKPHGARDVA
jgi:hypothetical protein